MLDNDLKDTPAQRTKDAELINKMAEAHFHFCNDQSAMLLAKLSLFIAPSDEKALRILANVEFRMKHYMAALDCILDIETHSKEGLDNNMRIKKALCLGKLGQVDAGRSVLL